MNTLQYALELKNAAFTGPMRMAQGSVKSFTSQLSNIGNIVTGLASMPAAINTLVAPLTQPITLAADMESLNEEMRILIGDAPKAAAMLKDIKGFADVTPFQMQGLVENAKMLLGFGASTKSVMPSLKMLGDVAGSSSDRMERLTLAYAQITAAGKLMGQDLLQLINAGFNPLQEISRTTGQSMSSLREQMEKGAISSDMVASAFRSATSAGGRFFGNTAAQGQTFNGVMSTMGDAWKDLHRAFGDPTMLALKPVIQEVTAMAVELKPLAADFGKTLSTGISGAFALFKSGDLGKTIQSAFIGLNKAIFSNIGVGLGAAMRVGAEVLKGVFQSAMNLFTDGGFWQSIKFQFLSVAESFRSVMLSTMADAVDSLPAAFRLGANTKEMRQQADASDIKANAHAFSASYVAGKINFEEITAPMISSASSAGTILGDSINQISTNLKNIPEFATIFENLKDAAAGLAPQIGGASLYDLVPPEKKREFLPVNETFLFDGGQGIGSQFALLDSMQKLLGATGTSSGTSAEAFMNSNMFGMGDGPKAADIKKSIDDSGLIKRLITLIERVETNTANLSPQGNYGY